MHTYTKLMLMFIIGVLLDLFVIIMACIMPTPGNVPEHSLRDILYLFFVSEPLLAFILGIGIILTIIPVYYLIKDARS